MNSKKIAHKKIGMRIFSLILAIVVWFYINSAVRGGPQAYKDLKDVEIQLMGEQLFLGKNVVAVEMERSAINLRVKGPSKVIEQLTRTDVIAYVNISGLRPGRTYSPVVNFILPPKIEIIGAPALVRVEIKDKNL
ncbi:MAG: CdaR family protein [Candidatus Omnitrophota bacterium]